MSTLVYHCPHVLLEKRSTFLNHSYNGICVMSSVFVFLILVSEHLRSNFRVAGSAPRICLNSYFIH
jgi:hypothetical protein